MELEVVSQSALKLDIGCARTAQLDIGSVCTTELEISNTGRNGDETAPVYTGEYELSENGLYEIYPSATDEIMMSTGGKKVSGNILIKSIPYAEVSNSAGGYTVSIAS